MPHRAELRAVLRQAAAELGKRTEPREDNRADTLQRLNPAAGARPKAARPRQDGSVSWPSLRPIKYTEWASSEPIPTLHRIELVFV
jgi:hypothetical protein